MARRQGGEGRGEDECHDGTEFGATDEARGDGREGAASEGSANDEAALPVGEVDAHDASMLRRGARQCHTRAVDYPARCC